MDSRYLHHLWTRIRAIKTAYLFTIFLLCSLVCVVGLRDNNVHMAKLRDAVYTADQKGDGVEQALQNLRAYVNGHMNTNLDNGKGVYPPVQLKYTYDRLVQAEQDRVSAANAKIYTEGQAYCETVNPTSFYGRDRVGCIQDYIKSHGTETAKSIPDALYKFDFVSPRWSPDTAGLALVASVAMLALTIIRFVLGRWLRAVTR